MYGSLGAVEPQAIAAVARPWETNGKIVVGVVNTRHPGRILPKVGLDLRVFGAGRLGAVSVLSREDRSLPRSLPRLTQIIFQICGNSLEERFNYSLESPSAVGDVADCHELVKSRA